MKQPVDKISIGVSTSRYYKIFIMALIIQPWILTFSFQLCYKKSFLSRQYFSIHTWLTTKINTFVEFNDPGLIFDIIIESAKNAENVSIFHSSFFLLRNMRLTIYILCIKSNLTTLWKSFIAKKYITIIFIISCVHICL